MKKRSGSTRSGRDRNLFASAMRDVVPLEQKSRIVAKRRIPEPSGAAGSIRPAVSGRFVIERWSEQITGRAHGEDPRLPGRLQRHESEPDLRVDLHGCDLRAGRSEVEAALERVWNTCGRYLLIVHGRGLRSQGAPVLKEALAGWLEESPHAHRIRAFATASPSLGGAGATLILLRRKRR